MTDAQHSDDAARQALLELLLAEEGLASGGAGSIPRRDPETAPVLSFAQERLWFMHQLESDTSALCVRAAVRIPIAIDIDALQRSLDSIIARHSSLRTLIGNAGGEPKPHVIENVPMPLIVDDIRGEEHPDERIARVLDEEARRTFDLEGELPIMCRLVRVADHDNVLSIVIHHVAADGWSFVVLFSELSELYGAEVEGREAGLAELPIDYADYASWQRTHVAGEHLERQLLYWRQQLAGPRPVCEIPPDFARPAVHTFEGGQHVHSIGPEMTARIKSLAADLGATPFMVLLAGFDVVMARYMGHGDVIIGTPVAGRVRPELESMIGMFINTLALRTQLDDDPTFAELVGRVRETALGAFDHQDVSFEQVLADVQPRRDLSRTPIFQVFFNMLNLGAADQLSGGRMPFEVISQPDLGAKFDATLYVTDRADRLDLLLVYNRGLYHPETMRHLLEQYTHVIEQAVVRPAERISHYSLVTARTAALLPDDSEELDSTWHGSVPDAVRRSAERHPDRIVVSDPATSWTYRDLACHMEAMASWMLMRGVGKGQVVAIYGHRSSSLVCAVVAALAAGAGYLLLDSRYPPSRLATYLRIARPDAWLNLTAAGPPPTEVLEVLDELGIEVRRSIPSLSDLDREPARAPIDRAMLDTVASSIGPDDLACVTFTSGSTGRPKAVMGRHGSLTHFLPWQSERFGIGPDDRFSMLSGLAHDPIQRDMFWALWVGATIVVPDPEQIGTPGWLADWLRRERISVAHLTPAMGQLITTGAGAETGGGPIESLRAAFFIGDVLTRRDAARFRQLAPNVQIVNLYGTTETQRASGYRIVDPESDLAPVEGRRPREILPLGVGIPGTQLLVRGHAGTAVGVGEIGEVWMRSHHLALGYLDQPDDTAARFVDDHSASPRARVYRTGDRGRHAWNGEVEFLGRGDDQVQLRGFRIELGEIRSALMDLAEVDDAIVITRDDDGVVRLVAYVVMRSSDADLRSLRRLLSSRLPAHMVPAEFVALPAMPLTPSGKVDRQALPAPEREHVTIDDAPRDEIERHLVSFWEEVLERTGIGIHDDFFELGGFSLLATRVFAMIEEQLGSAIPLSALFEAPTIAQLAQVVRGDAAHAPWTSLVPVQPNGSRQVFFYVAPYRISVLTLASLAAELGDDQPLYGFQPQGLDGSLPTHDRIEDMAAHYIAEMREVQPRGPYRLGGHCSGAWVAFEMARQLELDGERVESLVLVDHGPPPPGLPNATRRLRLQYRAHSAFKYLREGRLRYAVSWRVRQALQRVKPGVAEPVPETVVEQVRSIHRAAYQFYGGYTVESDITFVASEQRLPVPIKQWYARWGEKTSGRFHHLPPIRTRVNLLDRPHVGVLADRIRTALELADGEIT
jgi:amino acid adenylation domain-containing protein